MYDIKRKIHLDFHTSPYIPDIGGKFDKKQFQNTLKTSGVESICLFAKCHNGYTYYPSAVSPMHPELHFDLLGAQIEAAHEIGVAAPVYIPVGWSEADAWAHPDWCVHSFADTFQTYYPCTEQNKDLPRPFTKWSLLCPTGEYLDLLAALTEEICARYAPIDGMFFDICFFDLCVCERCKQAMLRAGLNPDDKKDVTARFKQVRIEMMERLSSIVKRHNANATVFFNGSCTSKHDPDFLRYQTHYEMEVLPTVEGNFDDSDLYCRRLEKYGKDVYGMTARFQGSWGEFGSYKAKRSLRYEIANCLSLGIGAIVGDHCHPNGHMDEAAYANIGYAYDYMRKYEKYCLGTARVADVGVVFGNDDSIANHGVNKFLLGEHIDYKEVSEPQDLEGVRLLILTDDAVLSPELTEAVRSYARGGGAVLAAGQSLKGKGLGIEYIGGVRPDVDYLLSDTDIGLKNSPLLMDRAACVTCGEKGGFTPSSEILLPYFSRTNAHFSGHKNTPYADKADYPAVWQKESFVYFAHDIFSLYFLHGSSYLRSYIRNALDTLYPDRILEVKDFSIVGRARLRKNEAQRYYVLHLLYASACKWDENFSLEDFPSFYNTEVTVGVPENIASATNMITGESIPMERKGNKTVITVPEWSMHALVILRW